MTARALLALMVLLASACDPRLRVSHVAPLEDGVLAVDDGLSIARVIRVDAASTESEDVALSEGPVHVLDHPDAAGTVLVFTEGEIGSATDEPVDAELVAFDRTGEIGRWQLAGQYGEVRASGRYAVALGPLGRLVVENRVEVVDTTRPQDGGNPVALSLRSLGGETPTAAAFSEPLSWNDGGGNLRVAALFAAGQLSLFDLDRPDVAPITIPTTTDGSTIGPAPVEGVFVGSELLVRASSGRQLLVVALTPAEGARRFDVSVRTLAASSPITRMMIDARGGGTRVVALADRRVHFFDLATGIEASLTLPAGYHEVLPFDGPAPGDATVRPRLVLYGYAPSLTFVELGDAPTAVLGSSTLALTEAPASVVADPARGRLVLFGGTRGGRAPLDAASSVGLRPTSIIDLYDRSALALGTTGEITAAAVTSGRTAMWVSGRDGYVARFDLGAQSRYQTWLSRSAETLLPLHGESERVIAFHSLRTGTFSVLEASGEEAPRLVADRF